MDAQTNINKDELKLRVSQLSDAQKKVLAKRLNLTGNANSQKLVAYVTNTSAYAADDTMLAQHANAHLPKHFVPSQIVQVKSLPRTDAGKLQRKQLNTVSWELAEKDQSQDELDSDEDFFDIFSDGQYAPPTNDIETSLESIWCDVLGLDKVSIHDEFLEVGGDSLLSIRILARINKAGLSIRTEDFFQYPTIAGQAKAILEAKANAFDVGSTKGKFELIPIQHWLFERVQADCHHWNQSVLLKVDNKLSYQALERALQMLLAQHDALRISFLLPEAGDIQQRYQLLDPDLPLERHTLPNEATTSHVQFIESTCERVNASMQLEAGKLAKFVYFENNQSDDCYLAVIIHHLLVDAESWRIIIEDLQSFWQSYAQEQTPKLPDKTSSYKLWSQKIIAHAQSDGLSNQIPFWQAQASDLSLPMDISDDSADKHALISVTHATTETMTSAVDLGRQESIATRLSESSKHFKVDVIDILIGALLESVHTWSGNNELVIDIEGHGREGLFDKVDITRTVGWFTSVYPVLFKLDDDSEIRSIIPVVNATLSKVPNKGIGHGILKENCPEAQLKHQAYSQICFNYLGDTSFQSSESNQETSFEIVKTNFAKTRSSQCKRAFPIEVNARIENNQLLIEWSYSHQLHTSETIHNLAGRMSEQISTVLDVSSNAPADGNDFEDDDLFDLSDLNVDEISSISKALGND